MALRQRVLDLLDTRDIRFKLGMVLDRSEDSIRRYIKINDRALTTYDALRVIREETGLTDEEILEGELQS